MTKLVDNDPEDQYYYMVTVYTSIRGGAGTESHIGVTIAGENGDTGIRQLSDGMRKVCTRLVFIISLKLKTYPIKSTYQ